MSELKYYTRANELPNMKPKVYLSCHPDDFATYFDRFRKKILNIHNCSIWYESQPLDIFSLEDLKFNLTQMQLVVLIVTSNLLLKNNRIIDVEYPFFVSKHIPVLFIVTEPKIENLFEKRFGSVQFLDYSYIDPTQIDPDKKLKKYLEKSLVGEELANRIRSAFDTYIFLSYRKKDRAVAHRLMHIIHNNPICQNIAIWYDEFLTPGENYNKEIEEMLQKCDLFTLVVTPNLVNEINYVITTEYPVATENKKTILPVEMVKTDPKKLQEMFPNFPPCIEDTNHQLLYDRLLKYCREIAVNNQYGTKEHKFLIGMAYLNGIDVEVDYEKAVVLITEAAEEGLLEAREQLAEMFHEGKSVRKDLHEAILHQKKIVDIYKKKYRVATEKHSLQAQQSYIDSLWNLSVMYNEIGKANESKKLYKEILNFLDGSSCNNKETLQYKSEIYMQLYVAYLALGQGEEAQNSIIVAHSIIKESLAENDEEQLRLNYILCTFLLGINYFNLNEYSKANKCYEEALSEISKLEVVFSGIEKQQLIIKIYLQMTNLKMAEENYSEAQSICYKVKNLCQDLYKDTESIEFFELIGYIYYELANIHMAMDSDSERSRCLYKALEYISNSNTVSSQLLSSEIHYSISDTLASAGEIATAKKYCLKSVKKIESLSKEMDLRILLARRYSLLGNIYEKEHSIFEAKKYYLMSIDLLEAICEANESLDYRIILNLEYERMGNISLEEEEISVAIQYHQSLLNNSQKMYMNEPNDYTKGVLANSYISYGKVLFLDGRTIESEAIITEGLNNLWELYEETEDYDILEQYVVGLTNLGELLENAGDSDKAKYYNIKNIKIRSVLLNNLWKLYKESKDYSILGEYADGLADLGELLENVGDLDRAKRYYIKSAENYSVLLSISNTIEDLEGLRNVNHSLADIYLKNEELDKAKKHYQKSLGLSKKIWKSVKTYETGRILWLDYIKLGDYYKNTSLKKAIKQYLSGLKLLKKMSSLFVHEENILDSIKFNPHYTATYDGLMYLYRQMGNDSEARKYSRMIEEKQRQIDKLLYDIDERIELIDRKEEDDNKKINTYKEKLLAAQSNYKNNKSIDELEEIVLYCRELGDLYINKDTKQNILTAKEYYDQQFDILNKIIYETGNSEKKLDLANEYGSVGCLYYVRDEWDLAIEYFKKKISILESIYVDSQNTKIGIDLCYSYSYVGSAYLYQEKAIEIAESYYKKVDTLSKVILEEEINDEIASEVGFLCEIIANDYRKLKYYSRATVYYNKILDLIPVIYANKEKKEKEERTFDIWIKLAEIMVKQGDMKKAQEYYEKSIELGNQIYKETKETSINSRIIDCEKALKKI